MSSVDLSTFLVVFAGVAVLILIAVGAYALTAKQRRRKQALRDVVAAGLLVRGDAPSETQSKEEQPGSPRRGEPPAGEQGVDVLDRPEAASSRLVRLRGRLVGSHTNLGRGMLMLLGREHIDQSTWEQVEDLLLQADVGVQPTQELVQLPSSLVNTIPVISTTSAKTLA